jgi:hypothetical protein
MYYEGVWGVDSLRVKLMESGLIIRFAWRCWTRTKPRSSTIRNPCLP